MPSNIASQEARSLMIFGAAGRMPRKSSVVSPASADLRATEARTDIDALNGGLDGSVGPEKAAFVPWFEPSLQPTSKWSIRRVRVRLASEGMKQPSYVEALTYAIERLET